MTILDKIAENALKHPERMVYYRENTENFQSGGGKRRQFILGRAGGVFQPFGRVS